MGMRKLAAGIYVQKRILAMVVSPYLLPFAVLPPPDVSARENAGYILFSGRRPYHYALVFLWSSGSGKSGRPEPLEAL
jgi:hypothetical protein